MKGMNNPAKGEWNHFGMLAKIRKGMSGNSLGDTQVLKEKWRKI